MKKISGNPTKTATILAGALGISVFLIAAVTTPVAVAHDGGNSCTYTCPTVHFEWSSSSCPSEDTAYTSNDHTKDCKRQFGSGPHKYYKYADEVVTNHSADVVYEKSHDPHKCHRPSDDTLNDVYHMNHSVRNDFKRIHSEWKDAIASEQCNQTTPTPTVAPTGTPEVTPEVTPTVTPETTLEVTPTQTPNNPPSPQGDGKSDGKSDGRSSCPECTKAPSGNVLGASIGGGDVLGASTYAGTGVSADLLMNALGLTGAAFMAMGTALSKRKSN
jgi:hypothetical protein